MKEFAILMDNISKAISKLPPKIATEAVNFSKERFVKQNWDNKAWEPRSRRRRGGEKRQNGAILVDSGRLKRAIRKKLISPTKIIIGVDVPYAEAHNEGLDKVIKIKAHNRKSRKGRVYKVKSHSRDAKLPQRRFMGESEELNTRIEKLIVRDIENAAR
ncbi:MAG: phage virion morphosis family protein [Bacteroidetes bacterium]|nr:phage virion morphosis family protein [Bacteroidota bacterium]